MAEITYWFVLAGSLYIHCLSRSFSLSFHPWSQASSYDVLLMKHLAIDVVQAALSGSFSG